MTEKLRVLIQHGLPSPLGGGIVWTEEIGTGRPIRIVADGRSVRSIGRLPDTGEIYQVSGQFETHRVYAGAHKTVPVDTTQFRAVRFIRRKLLEAQQDKTNQNTVLMLKYKPYFRGIGLGPAKIASMDKAYPNGELAQILDELVKTANHRLLTVVPGVGVALATRIREIWEVHRIDAELATFLDQYGIDRRLSRRIIRGWGSEALARIKKNPFRLTLFASWESVQDICLNKLGISPRDPRRQVAAVANAMWQRLDEEGHTWIATAALRSVVMQLLDTDAAEADKAIRRAASLGPKVIVGNDHEGYQPFGPHVLEQRVAARIKSVITDGRSPGAQSSLIGWDSFGPAEIDHLIARFEALERQAKPGFSLNPKQRLAIYTAVLEPFSLLTGFAGCGKTTVLKAIRYVVEAIGCRSFPMALAGRAAQRIREATGGDADTIMGFIAKRMRRQLDLQGGELIMIDECSMVDLPLLYKLFKHLPRGIRMLMVGDPAQLPPISFGLCFHELVKNAAIPQVMLDEVVRNAEDSVIPYVAREIREGRVPSLPNFAGKAPGISFIPCDRAKLLGKIDEVLDAFGGPDGVQILGMIKDDKGRGGGTYSINRHCQMRYADGDVWEDDPHQPFVVGEPIIYLENNYDQLIFNGTLGRLEQINRDRHTFTCRFDGKQDPVEISWINRHQIDLAYSITTHKSQGSEFDATIIPIFEAKPLDRSLIYTALTRSVSQAVFMGDPAAFKRAIEGLPAAERRQVGGAIRLIVPT